MPPPSPLLVAGGFLHPGRVTHQDRGSVFLFPFPLTFIRWFRGGGQLWRDSEEECMTMIVGGL